MPRLWNETIEAHRRDVHSAILATTARLVAERGVLSVTMSQIAEDTGIGRATLYKYFPDVDAILVAWHESQIAAHLDQLTRARDRGDGPADRLRSVLEAYAAIQHGRRDVDSGALAEHLHGGEHAARVQQRLRALIRDVVSDAAAAGDVRRDVRADELAAYCMHALGAAVHLPTRAAVRRLVGVTATGLAGPRGSSPTA